MSFISDFCNETEALLLSSCHNQQSNYPNSSQTLRNLFINLFLRRFLPSTIQIGSGIIVDHFGSTSTHQSLILYRTDFPIFPTNSESKTFLMESVLATIEILPPSTSGKGIEFPPLECFTHLTQPFTNSASVKNLRTAKHRIFADNSWDHMELSSRLKPKTFLFSFENKVDHQSFYDHYNQAKQATLSVVPDGICIPGSTGFYARYDPYHRNTNFHTDEPFIHFFQHLFQILVGEINSHNWQLNNNASIKYDLKNYLSLEIDKIISP
jgi:hypothetical protein